MFAAAVICMFIKPVETNNLFLYQVISKSNNLLLLW